MTSTEHPPPHVLAELTSGPQSLASNEPASSSVHDHVRHCVHCQDVLSQLGEVTQLLRAAPAQLPVPGHVADRLRSALVAEAAEAAGGLPEQTGQQLQQQVHHEHTGASVTEDDSAPVAWFRRRLPQALAAAAAAALIGFGGYVVLSDEQPPSTVADGAAGEGEDLATLEEQSAVEDAPAAADEQLEQPQAGEEEAAGDDDSADADRQRQDLSTQAVTDVWEQQTEVEPGCGAALADETGLELVGSTRVGADILVVVTDDTQLTGWLVPTCAATDASAESLSVPVPAE